MVCGGDVGCFSSWEGVKALHFSVYLHPYTENNTAQAEGRSSLCVLISGMPFPWRTGDASSLPVWEISTGTVSSCTEIGTAAILCTSPTAYLAISWRSFGWYWVWIHSREEFSHTLPENKFVATYPHKVLNSPRYLLTLYFNCMSQPANNKSLLNLQWGFGGRDWKILLIILKMVRLFWVNEFYPFGCIRDLLKPIC